MNEFKVNDPYKSFLKTVLREKANELRQRYLPGGPPYDPTLVADGLGVEVQECVLTGIDGYVEIKDGKYTAVISQHAKPTRKRFTLAHELCHVLLMQQADKGKPFQLVRYRTNGKLPGLHQDPVEESLCNYFAGELLIPLSQVKSRIRNCRIAPESIFKLASDFHVSTQAAAVNIIKAQKRVTACSFWNLESLWPMPSWWIGVKTPHKSEMEMLESLVGERIHITQIWESYANKRQHFIVSVAPTPGMQYAMVLIERLENNKKTKFQSSRYRSTGP
jgi:hypothetical protein